MTPEPVPAAQTPADPRGGPPPPEVGALGLLRFGSELAMLVAVAFAGFWLAGGGFAGVALAVVAVGAAATVWGVYVAPRARRRIVDPGRLGVEVFLFGLAVAGLGWHGWWVYAALLAGGFIASVSHGRDRKH
ncbi:MAG: YrdB family protein [Nocardioidaceae bacterium]